MGVPRPAVNGATTSVGFTTKLVTVKAISADGKTAVAVDRQNTQVSVPMMIQRSKGQLPLVGEQWLVTQADAGQYTFSAVVATSSGQFPSEQAAGIIVNTEAPPNPSVGEVWINPSQGNSVSVWNGQSWAPLQFSAQAIAPQAISAAQISAQAAIAATQIDFTAKDIGGITTTISATQPAGPSFGDLWYNAAQGYALNEWSGTQWVAYQWGTQSIAANAITAELIAANTITAEQIAAGIVIAGVIDGTFVDAATFTGSVFQGNDFLFNPAGGFFYSGVPANGNLIATIANGSGVDAHGNPYTQGVYARGAGFSVAGLAVVGGQALLQLIGSGLTHSSLAAEVFGAAINAGAADEVAFLVVTSGKENGNDDAALQLFSEAADGSSQARAVIEFGGTIFATITRTGIVLPGGGTPPAVSGSSSLYATTAGTLQVVDGVDGEAYGTQRRSLISGAQAVTSTSPGVIFSTAVGVRTYRVHGQLYVVANQSAGGMAFQWNGPAGGGLVNFTVTEGVNIWSPGAKAAAASANPGITMISGTEYTVTFDGSVTFTSAGTFYILAANTVSGDTFQVGAFSFCDILPV